MPAKRSTFVVQWDEGIFTREKLLQWAVRQSDVFLFLEGGDRSDPYTAFDYALALDPQSHLRCFAVGQVFDELADYQHRIGDWLFGHLSYDLKNELERVHSSHGDRIGFPECFFFQPKRLLFKRGGRLEFHYLDGGQIKRDCSDIRRTVLAQQQRSTVSKLHFTLERHAYCKRVEQLQKHIRRGDFYEVNFCLELVAKGRVDALHTYLELQRLSQAPFSAFYGLGHLRALCSAPERYLCKRGDQITSQPIKGTAPRGLNAQVDGQLRAELQNSIKEQAENNMIVDLVRNDLSKIAADGSVKVLELRKVYSFPQVHQMISTISCRLAAGCGWEAALKASFPMGSMTGAPKVSALKAIEAIENFKRGLYSGAIGYISPQRDFDFNTVIRTLEYDLKNAWLSYPVGSAITLGSDAEKEYEECLTKSSAIRKILAAKRSFSPP